MSLHESKNLANHTRRDVLLELLAGYLLVFAIIGVLFGLAMGIDVRTPWSVICAIAALWMVLSAAAVLKTKRKGGTMPPLDKSHSRGGKI